MQTLACPPNEETPFTLLIRQDFERWYPEYLRSPAWRELRNQVLGRAGWRCEVCKAHAEEIHHLTYANVGNEALEDLQALCRTCHQKKHRK